MAAERQVINPWSWQDEFSFVQANEVRNIQRMLICAGQASIEPKEDRFIREICAPSSSKRWTTLRRS
jgi:hypothetical protein